MAGIIDPKKYFMAIVAGLLILGITIGAFVWSFLTGNSLEKAEEKLDIERSADTVIMEPINMGVPSTAPGVPFPEKGPGEE